MDDEDHGELKLHFIDDANWPKLLSESGKHIVIESLETDDISWEELPRYLKEDIFGDGGW